MKTGTTKIIAPLLTVLAIAYGIATAGDAMTLNAVTANPSQGNWSYSDLVATRYLAANTSRSRTPTNFLQPLYVQH